MSIDPVLAEENLNRLTPREAETLRLMAKGLGTREVAAKFGCHEATPKKWLGSAYQKLGVGSRPEAWTAIGWLDVPDDPVAPRPRRGHLVHGARSPFIVSIICSWKKHKYQTRNGVTTCARKGCNFTFIRGTEDDT